MEFIEVPFSKLRCGNFKPPNLSLAARIQFLPSGEQLKLLLHSTGEYLRTIVKSDGWIHYMVDEAIGELYISPTDQTDTSNTSRYGWSIEQDETIAVYCYKRKSAIIVDANTSADLNYPYLQGIPGLNPRYILTMPLVNFQKRCFGVVEFYRDSGESFSDADVNSCRFLLQQCAEAFKQNENTVFFATFNEIQSQLQELLEKYTMIDGPDSSSTFLYHVVSMARDCTQALNTSFSFRKNDETVRIVNTDRDYCFISEEANTRRLGSITRSEISANFHVNLMNRHIHGIIRACNKTNQMRFCLLDEQILEAFSKMCTIWSIIEYISGYVKKQKALNENILNLIKIQMMNASDFNKKLQTPMSADMSIFNSWNYDLGAAPSNRQLLSDAVKMICCIKGKLKIQEQGLCDFAVMVEQCHASVQDFYHTVLSTQGLYRLLEGCREFENDMEAFAMIIVCFCYNIAVNDTPTPTSSIFLRYNLYAKELIRFEIVQFVIQETKLLIELNNDEEENLLRLIKENMIDMNLRRMKLNTARLGQIVRKRDIKKLEARNDTGLRILIKALLPGIGHVLGHFRSQEFRELFPNFGFFEYLETNKLSCVDIIQAISPM